MKAGSHDLLTKTILPSSVRSLADGYKPLRYNRGVAGGIAGTKSEGVRVLGRGQVARHRVLVPGSQVRILPPQPVDSE